MSLTVAEVLGSGGTLSRRIPGFSERPAQVRMAEAVAARSRSGGSLMVEAPTGTGKSLAYLVPVLLEAVAAGRKVVVSTHTINLQDQLLGKDLPLLASCLPVEFSAAKAIGRTHYLGLRRMGLALGLAPTLVADDPQVRALQRVRKWSESAEFGLRSELEPPPPSAVWSEVQSEGDNCLGRRCATHDQCFYMAARRRLHTADVIVTNHALYLVDLVLRRLDMGLLPDHDVLVVDEAHTFEHVARDQLGLEVSRAVLGRLLARLGGRGRTPGLVTRLKGPEAGRMPDMLEMVRGQGAAFFSALNAWHEADREKGVKANGRFREPDFVPEGLSEPMLALALALDGEAEATEDEELAVEVEAFANRTRSFAETLREILGMKRADHVHAVSVDARRSEVSLHARPLEVADVLAKELHAAVRTTVMTSATLGPGGEEGLGTVARTLGCPKAERLALPSPFRLDRQAEAHAIDGLPEPHEAAHGPITATWMERYVLRSRGGAFLLFTSWRALEDAWRRLRPGFETAGLLCLRQSPDEDRGRLLQRFREHGRAVLFGTDSFWAGVDVPGEALRLVMVPKLPFPRPNEPILEARSERLKRSGGNPFAQLLLPEAIIRFRQGFGRLIRTETDEGLFVCLDSRLATKPYGRRFRESLGVVPWRRIRSAADFDAQTRASPDREAPASPPPVDPGAPPREPSAG